MTLPEFDFSSYDPRDPWNFPPQRLVRFAAEASMIVRPYRNKCAISHSYPDIRFVTFQEIHSAVHSVHVLSCLISDHILDPDWWASQPSFGKALEKDTMQANHNSLRDFMLSGLLKQLTEIIDQSFRQILHVILHQDKSALRLTPRQATSKLLNYIGLIDYEALLTLIRILQASSLTSGKFCPANQRDLAFAYRGRLFRFENMKPLEGQDHGFIDTWDWLLFLLRELCQMLQTLFASPYLSDKPVIKARYLD